MSFYHVNKIGNGLSKYVFSVYDTIVRTILYN